MPGSMLLAAALAAVLCPHEVVFMDTGTGAVVRRVDLAADGLALFAAPDGRIVVPLATADGTAVVDASGKIERWQGRVFPLFFADFDRMHVVLPGALATISYPERVSLLQIPLPGLVGARRAACSADGRLVAVVPSGPEGNSVTFVAVLEGGSSSHVRLGGEASAIALAPRGDFAVVATGGGVVEVTGTGQAHSLGTVDLAGRVRSLACTADGRGALVGLESRKGGEIVGLRVDISAKEPLKERFRTPLSAGVKAFAVTGDEVVALAGDVLLVLSADGRKVRRKVTLTGAFGVALLPSRPRSAVPPWSDGKSP
jgi:hypothetical protein